MAWPCGPWVAPFHGRAAHGRPIERHADTGSCPSWPSCGSLIPDIRRVLGGIGKVFIEFGLWSPAIK